MEGSSGDQLEIPGVQNDLQAGDVINFVYTNGQSHLYTFFIAKAEVDTSKTNSTSAIDGDPVWISNNGQVNGYTISCQAVQRRAF